LGEKLVPNLQGKAVLQVEEASLAAILDLAATLANFGLLVTSFGSRFPSEHAEGTSANLAFRAKSVFGHSNVGIVAQANLEHVTL
jgi:hypothetical protein